MATFLDDLAERLSERNVRVLLIGGCALEAYGVVRQTLDIDWLATDRDVEKIKDVMNGEGYDLVAQTANFIRFRHRAIGIIDIDVVLVAPETFRAMEEAATVAAAPSSRWRVPSPAHLIALKLHAIRNDPSRESRDLADIVELLRAKRDQAAQETLRDLCQRYGGVCQPF